MEGKDEPKKIPKESSKAKLFCDAYLALGVERSLAKLALAGVDGMTVPKRWIEDWSRWYGWVERARAYDEEQLEKRRKTREQSLDVLYDELAELCKDQRSKTLKDLEKLRKGKGLGSIATVNLLKLLIDTHIQVLGGNEKQKVELTGKDGGKIEMETVVETFWGRGTDPRRKDRAAEPVEEEEEETTTEDEEEAGQDEEFGAEIPDDDE